MTEALPILMAALLFAAFGLLARGRGSCSGACAGGSGDCGVCPQAPGRPRHGRESHHG